MMASILMSCEGGWTERAVLMFSALWGTVERCRTLQLQGRRLRGVAGDIWNHRREVTTALVVERVQVPWSI